MAKDKNQDERHPDVHGVDPAVEERVRQMLDPNLPDQPAAPAPVPTQPAVSPVIGDQPSAPVVNDLPQPSEPLKIKIIKEDELEPEAQPEPTVPEVPLPLTPLPVEPAAESSALIPETPPVEDPTPKMKIPEPGPWSQPIINDEIPKAPENADIPPVVEDEQTAKAVDDIVAHESDELLAVQDAKSGETKTEAPSKPKKSGGKKRIIKWILLILVLALAAAAIYPSSRYYALNAAGVRSSTSLTVLDNSTQRPLKNVHVSINGASSTTDANGEVTLNEVKLGAGELKIEKRAFIAQNYHVTIGWGSNPMGEYKMVPSGIQYAFTVKDYLSGKPIAKAESSSGEATAASDNDGKILLTMAEPTDKFEVTITAAGYRTEKFKLNADKKTQTVVKMVPSRKHVFVRYQNGRYDVIKVDLDGKNEKTVLKGSGSEQDDMVLITHPTDDVAALVSTRTGNQNNEGEPLHTLTIIDLNKESAKEIDTVEKLQLVDWVGDRIIYSFTVPNANDNNPKRDRLMSYNYKDGDRKELAAANYFVGVVVADGQLYYAPAGAYQNGINVSLFHIQADGRNREVVLDEEIKSMSRVAYDKLVMSTSGGWFEFVVGKQPTKIKALPVNTTYRVFVTSPDTARSLYINDKSGLVVRTKKDGKEKTLVTQAGLDYPVSWLNKSVVVYRVNNGAEVADYAISINGGKPVRIGDVTNTAGVDQWTY